MAPEGKDKLVWGRANIRFVLGYCKMTNSLDAMTYHCPSSFPTWLLNVPMWHDVYVELFTCSHHLVCNVAMSWSWGIQRQGAMMTSRSYIARFMRHQDTLFRSTLRSHNVVWGSHYEETMILMTIFIISFEEYVAVDWDLLLQNRHSSFLSSEEDLTALAVVGSVCCHTFRPQSLLLWWKSHWASTSFGAVLKYVWMFMPKDWNLCSNRVKMSESFAETNCRSKWEVHNEISANVVHLAAAYFPTYQSDIRASTHLRRSVADATNDAKARKSCIHAEAEVDFEKAVLLLIHMLLHPWGRRIENKARGRQVSGQNYLTKKWRIIKWIQGGAITKYSDE